MRVPGSSNPNPFPSNAAPASGGFAGPKPSNASQACGGPPPGLNPSRVSVSSNYSGSSALAPQYHSGNPPQPSPSLGICIAPHIAPTPNYSGSGALAAQYNSGNPPFASQPSSLARGGGYAGPNLNPSRVSSSPNYSSSAALAGSSSIPNYVPSSSSQAGRGYKGPTDRLT